MSTLASAVVFDKEQHAALYPHGLSPLPQGVPMPVALDRLGGPAAITVQPLTQSSAFIAPQSVMYSLDGASRRWDFVSSHASVAILIYHRELDSFLLVRQFRPAVYAAVLREGGGNSGAASAPNASAPPPLNVGFTFELCAGIVDKPELSLTEIAREEVLEETGFDVPLKKVRKVTGFLSAVGISGSRQTIFAAEVDDTMAVSDAAAGGGGLAEHGEAIEVVALPVNSVDAFLFDESLGKSAGLMFALLWGREQLQKNGGGLFSTGP